MKPNAIYPIFHHIYYPTIGLQLLLISQKAFLLYLEKANNKVILQCIPPYILSYNLFHHIYYPTIGLQLLLISQKAFLLYLEKANNKVILQSIPPYLLSYNPPYILSYNRLPVAAYKSKGISLIPGKNQQ
jgi:hypothetical protein